MSLKGINRHLTTHGFSTHGPNNLKLILGVTRDHILELHFKYVKMNKDSKLDTY